MLKALKLSSILVLTTVVFVACDKDFSSIESDIAGEQNFSTQFEKFPVTAYSKKLNPVQTNGLPSNLLGVYKDQTLDGITTANVVTQIVPTTFNPDFGSDVVIESVILTIPYFVTNKGDDGLGNTLYDIDSLFGNAPIKLSIYRNNYFLSDTDPANIGESQDFYSNANETIMFDNHLGELLYENLSFVPNPDEIIIEEENDEGVLEEVERIAPSLRVALLNPGGLFWETLLGTNATEPLTQLSNANNFKNYFRGLYFKVEAIGNDGNMLMLNFANSAANITVNYTNESVPGTITESTFVMNFNGNRLNTFTNDFNMPLQNGDPIDGDENLFLKGGEGSMAIINLFDGKNTDTDDSFDNTFETFKKLFVDVDATTGEFIKSKRLINEVNLIFYVNRNLIQGDEPDRIALYDLKNNFPIFDFFADPSATTTDPLNSRIIYSPVLERDEVTKDGIRYKIRLTEHLNSIILRDSTNVKLGLVVSTNVNELQRSKILNEDDQVVIGSVLSPRGTVLHGSHPNVPEDQRVQLEIFYTEPN